MPGRSMLWPLALVRARLVGADIGGASSPRSLDRRVGRPLGNCLRRRPGTGAGDHMRLVPLWFTMVGAGQVNGTFARAWEGWAQRPFRTPPRSAFTQSTRTPVTPLITFTEHSRRSSIPTSSRGSPARRSQLGRGQVSDAPRLSLETHSSTSYWLRKLTHTSEIFPSRKWQMTISYRRVMEI
jgi:hypothetical protein